MPACPGIQKIWTWPGRIVKRWAKARLGHAFAASWKARMVFWLEFLGQLRSCRTIPCFQEGNLSAAEETGLFEAASSH